MSARHDRGLHAVSRVRDVRERDSRLGLQQALREQTVLQGTLDRLQESMRQQASFESGDMNQYVAARQTLETLREAASQVRKDVDSAAVITASARAHWLYDKTRLAAVEGLLERRADERRAEGAAREAHELDDVAGRLWLRRSTAQTTARTTAQSLEARKESA